MKCGCCNKTLNDYEATLRHATTGEFLDTCMKCLKGLGIPLRGREDLNKKELPEDEKETGEFFEFMKQLGDEDDS
jgi:hypothetical protein